LEEVVFFPGDVFFFGWKLGRCLDRENGPVFGHAFAATSQAFDVWDSLVANL